MSCAIAGVHFDSLDVDLGRAVVAKGIDMSGSADALLCYDVVSKRVALQFMEWNELQEGCQLLCA